MFNRVFKSEDSLKFLSVCEYVCYLIEQKLQTVCHERIKIRIAGALFNTDGLNRNAELVSNTLNMIVDSKRRLKGYFMIYSRRL